ncbi:hypothetical protein T11_16226 [Trichinella zimbabwensis]|uniref:Uncharacterized protein n=1 Tax=Trichinella zimbabwensis TaxID=268475 RepID=A0A0V1I8H2_9BILA|nr:hypothetical protein T11_16226 [Trichinella zimbabwensis]
MVHTSKPDANYRKGKKHLHGDECENFTAIRRANLHQILISGEAASSNAKAAQEFPEQDLQEIITASQRES